MYLHQLINRDKSVVVIHTITKVAKLLSSSGAVFNGLPASADDISSTLSPAHAILFDDAWELADAAMAERELHRWKNERIDRVLNNARAPRSSNAVTRPVVAVPPLQTVKHRGHLRLVHAVKSNE